MTDYTCIPFWEETCCDYYIVPHPALIDECAKRGIPQEKMIPFGIPVRKCFRNLMDQEKAKEKLGFSPEKKLHLLIGGSMGAGNLEKLELIFFAKRIFMKSILIKDTTKEERAKIVADSLGDDYELGCGYESAGINYDLYIEGKKELRELNSEALCGFEVAYPEDSYSSSCMKF